MLIQSRGDLLFDQLRDLISVETQLVPSMPKLAYSASTPELASLLRNHSEETKAQKKRLDRIFEILGEKPGNDTSKAMKGLIKGGEEHLEKVVGPRVKDLLLIAHCNRVEHYEMAGYMFAVSLAECEGQVEIASLLTETLEEERTMVAEMARIASGLFGDCDDDRRNGV